MKIYLVSNNNLVNNLSYQENNLDIIRIIRPLSFSGEYNAKKISEYKELNQVSKVYASQFSSSLGTAKYLSEKLNLDIIIDSRFNDCKVGYLGSKNMKMVKGLQEHDFNYKLNGGESLNDVGLRIENAINSLEDNSVIFTHKRAILGYLIQKSSVGYNLDDSLILEYNNKQIYDDTDTLYDIYELTYENNELMNIEKIS